MFSDLPKRELVAALESATAQLASADDDLRFFFDAIDDLLFVLDAQGTILFTNKAVTAKLGYSAAELAGQSVLCVHPPARRAEAAEIVEAMLAGATTTCPVPVLTKDGREIPVETSVVKARWRGQKVVFGITRDLSALRASEERFKKAFHVNATNMAITEITTFEDINDQVTAQRTLTAQHEALQETNRQLEQSRNMLQLIIESIPLRVFWKDTDLRYLGCNRLFAHDSGEESP
ncbi:MAG: PAS domain S-box protein, partial [Caldilinea sp.]|nr:PAS domain S-box protein [Caldilinea sp.]